MRNLKLLISLFREWNFSEDRHKNSTIEWFFSLSNFNRFNNFFIIYNTFNNFNKFYSSRSLQCGIFYKKFFFRML